VTADATSLLYTQHAAVIAAAAAVPADCFWTLETDDADGSKYVSIVLVKGAMGYQSWEALLESDKPDTTVTNRVRLQRKSMPRKQLVRHSH
jgi:hypothetical protein